MSSPNQPYSFGSVQGVVAKAGKKAEGFFKTKGKAAEKQLDHEYRVREKAIGIQLETQAQKKLIKAKGKAEKKVLRAKGEQERQTYGSKMASNVASARQMSEIAKPGSGVNLSDRGVSYTTPPAAKMLAKPKEPKKSSKPLKPSTPIKQSAPAPKNPKGNLARRSQMGRAMTKKGL